MTSDCYSQICSCPTWPTLGLASIALGLCRFACVLLLPHVPSLLHVLTGAGFLVGLLGASATLRRLGTVSTTGIAFGACALSLAMSTLTAQLSMLCLELAPLVR